ncbi:MAG: SIS domain-containing protein [Nanoarchaeota archaeon]|nr:SIS domain-containing protein [Nanoarchaeota archaeon]
MKSGLYVVKMIANELIDCFDKKDGKALIFGNGGSAAQAQHFAAELVGKYTRQRNCLPAISITTDTSILTATGNDYGFDHVFEYQIEAFGRKGDVAIGLSTSGNSDNVVRAFEMARRKDMRTIGLTGEGGGKVKRYVDILAEVPSTDTPRIQEAHIFLIHEICGDVEEYYVTKKT